MFWLKVLSAEQSKICASNALLKFVRKSFYGIFTDVNINLKFYIMFLWEIQRYKTELHICYWLQKQKTLIMTKKIFVKHLIKLYVLILFLVSTLTFRDYLRRIWTKITFPLLFEDLPPKACLNLFTCSPI